jgi:hypothetical protein
VDDRVHLGAVEEVVVDGLARQRTERQLERKTVVDVGKRGGIPHDRVTLARNKQRDRDVGVVLPEFDRGAAVVEHAALVLTQSIERFAHRWSKAVRNVVGRLAIQFDGVVGARDPVALVQERVAVGRGKG